MTVFDDRPAAALLQRHEARRYPYEVGFGEAHLIIDEGVFCPTLTKTSPFLLSVIDIQPGERVLDIFSGSGTFGIIAALRGAEVVTIDTSPLAVRCTRRNAALNGVEDRLEARLGDIREVEETTGRPPCLHSEEQFDVIIANPPLLPGRPRTPLEASILDPELAATVACVRALPRLLADSGRAYLLTSDVLERIGLALDHLATEAGLRARLYAVKDVGYERYRVHRLAHAGTVADDVGSRHG